MSDVRVDDEMIEIGDPDEEPTPAEAEAAHQVVIQYHERGGVPWMLIPPLLVLSAVAAVLLYTRFSPRANPARPPVVANVPAPLADNSPPPAETPGPAVEPASRLVEAPTIVEAPKVVEAPTIVEAPMLPVEPVPEPSPPKAQGLGFDPKALEADRKVEAPADPALAPVARQPPAEDRDLPREVDPDLLPPDPREARRRQERRKLEMQRKVESERARFHAELRVLCRKYREACGPEILEMRKKYDLKLDPSAEQMAMDLLGKNGKYAGADRRTRIDLLRSLGYPEPVILDSLYSTYEKQQVGERDGPRDEKEAYYFSALFLLRNPPPQVATTSRPPSGPVDSARSAR